MAAAPALVLIPPDHDAPVNREETILPLVSLRDKRSGRQLLGLQGEPLYTFTRSERRSWKGWVHRLQRVDVGPNPRLIAEYCGNSFRVGDSKVKYSEVLESKSKLGPRSRFSTGDADYRFDFAGWGSSDLLLLRINDEGKDMLVMRLRTRSKPLFSNSPNRGGVTLVEPDLFLDYQGRPTRMLEEVLLFWACYLAILFRNESQASAAAAGRV